jgi:hypothetical protein
MASILKFGAFPAPRLHDAHHRLAAVMDVNVLHRHLLPPVTAVAIERFEDRGEGAGELLRLGEVFAPTFEPTNFPVSVRHAPFGLSSCEQEPS